MQRLVYSPSIKVWVKTDSGVIDLTPYVTECTVVRKIDDLSHAEIQFRNPKVLKDGKPRFLFTENEYTGSDGSTSIRPVFHPMDPITIVLERIAGKPIQVFTGYCDTTPYVQLFPGTARIKASCTLKRLNYTYFDPGLDFVQDFMRNYGWIINVSNGVAVNEKQATKDENPKQVPTSSVKLHDSSIGNLLYAALNEIGGWDNKNIYIQSLPGNIAKVVGGLFDEFAKDNKDVNEEIATLVRQIIGSGSFGAVSPGQPNIGAGAGTGNSPVVAADAPDLLRQLVQECNRIKIHRTYYSQEFRNGSAGVRQPNQASDGAYYFDCSSFVSYMMNFIGHYGGNMTWAEVSGWFESSWGQRGEGRYLTVWANPDHVFLEIKNNTGGSKFIGTSGYVESQNPDSNSPVGHSHTIGWMSSYPTNGFTPKHIPGF